jgi:hypothetical protein
MRAYTDWMISKDSHGKAVLRLAVGYSRGAV